MSNLDVVNDPRDAAVRKAFWHLLPLLVVAYLVAFLDRVNIANAALTMNADLGLDPAVFGLGSGLFFVTYFLFGTPGNLVLDRLGARRWLIPSVAVLGVLTMAMALIRGPVSFVALRLLLGAAEAGFFPGIVLYLTYWFPSAYRARVTAAFMIAIPLSLAVGGPVANLILHLSGTGGLRGWQWLFLLEGTATLLVAVWMALMLPDGPAKVSWLSFREKTWLSQTLARETDTIAAAGKVKLWAVLANRQVLLLAYIYLANITANLGIAFFLPLMLKSLGASVTQANMISAVPYLAGVAGILFFGLLADRYNTRRISILIITLLVAAVGMGGAGLAAGGTLGRGFFIGPLAVAFSSIVFVALSAAGIYGTKAPFWPLPSLFLTGGAAALGIGFINAIGNLGGFVGPFIVGWVQKSTHRYDIALYFLAATAGSAAIAALFLGPIGKDIP